MHNQDFIFFLTLGVLRKQSLKSRYEIIRVTVRFMRLTSINIRQT
jgi:hypothetical protein